MDERICRVCLALESSTKFSKIFENNLALKIFLVTNVKIIELNNTPALICKSCEIEVYQCFNFRKKIQTSQEYFDRKLPYLETYFVEFLNQNKFEDSALTQEIVDDEQIDLNETIEEYLEFSEEENIENLQIIEENVEIDRKETSMALEKSTNKRLSCRYCGLKLSRRQKLIQHERLHILRTTNKYRCDKCGKNFNQRFGLIPHFQKYHNYKPSKTKEKWKCAICDDKLLPPGNLEVHYYKVHKEFYNMTNVESETNSIQFNFKKECKRTKAVPKSKKNSKIFFPCGICGNSFTTLVRYHKHLNDLHGVREQNILQTENTNGESPASSSKAKNHQKSVPCSTCGKMFANLNTCKTHEKIHSGLKFICDLCGSSFSMKPYLTSHVQKVHLKLKRFKCSMCNKTFVHRELLNYHIKKHLNIRNYSCQFCQKTFVRKACVMIHERIHKNERPYSCKYCERTFNHQSDQRRHEYRHINGLSYRSYTAE